MSEYRESRGPNLTQFLNNLNSLTSPYEQEHYGGGEELDLSQDLAMFTNTDFTHFDIPPLPEEGAFNFEMNEQKNDANVKYEDLLAGAEPIQGFNHPPAVSASTAEPSQYYSSYNTPIQPAPAHGFGPVETQLSPAASTSGPASGRRKADPVSPNTLTSEEKSRLAAEEDKRRRNTAASARFRIKKKQREQALERTVKEVQEKNDKLEAKLSQLEMENKWLKDLITEKNGMQSKEEMAAAYQQFRKQSEERELQGSKHTTGVGTE